MVEPPRQPPQGEQADGETEAHTDQARQYQVDYASTCHETSGVRLEQPIALPNDCCRGQYDDEGKAKFLDALLIQPKQQTR